MADGEDGARTAGDIRPVPDPTFLTTQLVERALSAYREVVDGKVQNLETRLHGMDRATELLAEELVKQTANLSGQRSHIREEFSQAFEALRESYTLQIKNVMDVNRELHAAIDTRFLERDTRTEETAQQSRISLDAALAAAKEAVGEQNRANTLAIGKSEASTQKQIDAQAELMANGFKSLDDKIGDLKGRLDRGEGLEKGTSDTRQRGQTQSNWTIGLFVAVGLSLLGTTVGIILALVR